MKSTVENSESESVETMDTLLLSKAGEQPWGWTDAQQIKNTSLPACVCAQQLHIKTIKPQVDQWLRLPSL